MTRLQNQGRTQKFAALLAATVATAVLSTPSFAIPRYDGLWSVSIVTEKGDCDRGYRYPIRISNGQLVNAGDAGFTITGKVGQTGRMMARTCS